ncbi:M14 family zinc carboxypeptidase [Aquimarina agarivorans]|uniref:M14 family zinc carboxypeptidase n=1 Tax=Aquimarina agarivorans TaxID=980584 RepID=UPI000248FCC4|nr:M14 family zinc carboxypeptidase [Aquimarina agarivorans]
MKLYNYISTILEAPFENFGGKTIGVSLEAIEIDAFIFGNGPKKISLIAGNHADEPIGPLLLKKLVNFLSLLNEQHELLLKYTWYIIPHTNPDGEKRNLKWYTYQDTEADLANYLTHVTRELPGQDIEFGFPIENKAKALRPENEAIYNFWKKANTSFDLHVSLHGMSATYGPWFLIDKKWINRTQALRDKCTLKTKALGYQLFDLNRFGEKGFERISKGFCTRPDSTEMRNHFLALNDKKTAEKFHPSSMESIRSISTDCLTLVSEMPLFIFPEESRQLTWPDPFLQKWNTQFTLWKQQIRAKELTAEQCNKQAKKMNVNAMPWKDQMRLQWQLVVAGIETIEKVN